MPARPRLSCVRDRLFGSGFAGLGKGRFYAAPNGAKGASEEQTRRLFEVCRLRDVPIITFVNKLDREARDPFDLLDEIEQPLALDVTRASWLIGMGRDFLPSRSPWVASFVLSRDPPYAAAPSVAAEGGGVT